MALRYQEAVFDDNMTPQILELMATCFPRSDKFSPAYLHWLHSENPEGTPVGYHLFDDQKLVGQLIGLPQRVILRNASARVILLTDVSIHPDQRGAGHFLDLTKRTCDMAASRGFAAVTGVANNSTYRGYPKIGFQDVGGLNARVSLLSNIRLDAEQAVERAEFYRDWDDRLFGWRLRNPYNPLRVIESSAHSITVDGEGPYPGLRVRAIVPRRGLAVADVPTGGRRRPSLIIGLEPAGTSSFPLAVSVPERFKPSPLRMIYLDLADRARRLDPSRVLFSFLDFDLL